MLCAKVLYQRYPRLTQAPLNLQSEELLSSVVERLLKAMQKALPNGVRQFFAMANQHMRWELNDLARRLDKEAPDIRKGKGGRSLFGKRHSLSSFPINQIGS